MSYKHYTMARITQTKIAHIRHVMDIIDFENLSRADTIVKDFVYDGIRDMIDQLCMPETDEAVMLMKELNAKMDG